MFVIEVFGLASLPDVNIVPMKHMCSSLRTGQIIGGHGDKSDFVRQLSPGCPRCKAMQILETKDKTYLPDSLFGLLFVAALLCQFPWKNHPSAVQLHDLERKDHSLLK
jgi:hypothetical protein